VGAQAGRGLALRGQRADIPRPLRRGRTGRRGRQPSSRTGPDVRSLLGEYGLLMLLGRPTVVFLRRHARPQRRLRPCSPPLPTLPSRLSFFLPDQCAVRFSARTQVRDRACCLERSGAGTRRRSSVRLTAAGTPASCRALIGAAAPRPGGPACSCELGQASYST